jgi:hypothetical protein
MSKFFYIAKRLFKMHLELADFILNGILLCFGIFWRRSLLEKGCFIFIRTSKIFHLLRVFECVNYTFVIIFLILIRFIFCKVNTIVKIIILDYTITLFDLSKEERVCLKSLRCLYSNFHVTSLWSYFIF